MRITQIMLSKGFGGGERLFLDICLSLLEAGHKVQAICHPAFECKELLSHPGIQLDCLEVHLDHSPLARYRLKKMLKRFNPDIIHTHMVRASFIGGSVGNNLGIKVVANLHNYVNVKYYRQISHFFPGTEDQKKYLIKQGKNAADITVIPHFSKIPVTTPIPTPEYQKNTIISYGRFVKKKGFDILIKSLSVLKKQGIELKLILGGDGPEKKHLSQLVSELELKNNVQFTGWVEDVPQFLSQASVFVLPSLEEPFGIVILEAMAQGKTIITTKTPGPVEVFDNTCAWMVDIGNTHDMAKAISEAVMNEKVAYQKAVKANKRYIDRYAPDKIIPVFEAEYSKAITQN